MKVGVSQGSCSGPLIFIIYVNNLPCNIESTIKFLAADISLTSTINSSTLSSINMPNDLNKIPDKRFNWKKHLEPGIISRHKK